MPDPNDQHSDNPGPDQSEKECYNSQRDIWLANQKKLFDTFLDIADKQARDQSTLFDKIFTDAQQYDNQRQNISNQALQNAVETANMVGKQTIRHADLAIDRQWNLDEQAALFVKVLESLKKNGYTVTPPPTTP